MLGPSSLNNGAFFLSSQETIPLLFFLSRTHNYRDRKLPLQISKRDGFLLKEEEEEEGDENAVWLMEWVSTRKEGIER